MNLCLIRHGEKGPIIDDVSAIELTDKGFRQADLVGKRLQSYNINMIFSSTMVRARQTTAVINKYTNVEIEYREALREIDLGDCDSKGWDYVRANYPDFIAALEQRERDVPYPKGECGNDVWIRVSEVIKEIISLKLENVAIVTHSGTIRSIICGVLGLPQAKRFSFGKPPEHCGITCIKFANGQFDLHIFNDYSHIGAEDI